jgi:hypothetical protein
MMKIGNGSPDGFLRPGLASKMALPLDHIWRFVSSSDPYTTTTRPETAKFHTSTCTSFICPNAKGATKHSISTLLVTHIPLAFYIFTGWIPMVEQIGLQRHVSFKRGRSFRRRSSTKSTLPQKKKIQRRHSDGGALIRRNTSNTHEEWDVSVCENGGRVILIDEHSTLTFVPRRYRFMSERCAEESLASWQIHTTQLTQFGWRFEWRREYPKINSDCYSKDAS